jgi:hypothetical protein
LVKKGIDEGWAASGELDGPKYRRGRVRYAHSLRWHRSFTLIWNVLADRIAICRDAVYVYHDCLFRFERSVRWPVSQSKCDRIWLICGSNNAMQHPYGEINCVVPIDDTFELEGLPVGENWQGAGWTSLSPGTHHYPRSRGGRGVALFFLPSGRIAYDAQPGEPQPTSI